LEISFPHHRGIAKLYQYDKKYSHTLVCDLKIKNKNMYEEDKDLAEEEDEIKARGMHLVGGEDTADGGGVEKEDGEEEEGEEDEEEEEI